MGRICLNCDCDLDTCLRLKSKGEINCCPECQHYSKNQRNMAIYELHKVINKKDEEIAKLTKALVETREEVVYYMNER